MKVPTIMGTGSGASGGVSHAIADPTGGTDGLATQLGRLLAGSADETADLVSVLGQQIRLSVRNGSGVPLVLCNGIGASLEALDPLVDQLDPNTTVIRFDAPGIDGYSDSPLPYSFPYLSAVLGRLLSALDLDGGGVDVLGFSWGGALAQQFAFPEPAPLPATDLGVDWHWHRNGAS